MAESQRWSERLADERSGKVVFLSHCLLNQNTRYLGGACRPGCIQEILQSCIDSGLGIVQMPCPEQLAWGGVLKRALANFLRFRRDGPLSTAEAAAARSYLHTRRVYRKLARQVADQVEDYFSSGMIVVGIVGVDASPTCGVAQTLDLRRSLDLVGRLPHTARAEDMNEIVLACRAAGTGLFVELLRREFQRRRLDVPFMAHDLIAELQGKTVPLRV